MKAKPRLGRWRKSAKQFHDVLILGEHDNTGYLRVRLVGGTYELGVPKSEVTEIDTNHAHGDGEAG